MLLMKYIRLIVDVLIFLPTFFILFMMSIAARVLELNSLSLNKSKRLIFSGKPIPGLISVSKALKKSGFIVWSVANDRNFIGEDKKFDTVLAPNPKHPPGFRTLIFALRIIFYFGRAVYKYDILHAYFNGGMLGRSPLKKWEFWLWKLANKKLVLLSYGSDAFIYSHFTGQPWAKAIMQTYPRSIAFDMSVAKDIQDFGKLADVIVGCLVHWVHLPKVSFNPLLWYPMEAPENFRNINVEGPIKILHAPNHRGIKGTDFLISAVDRLKIEGHDIDLNLIENQPREKVLIAIENCDIVIDQLLMGYALLALEGMRMGRIVVTGIDLSDPVYSPHVAELEKSPLIFSNPDEIYITLKELIENRGGWQKKANQIHEYAKHHHSEDNCVKLFRKIYDHL